MEGPCASGSTSANNELFFHGFRLGMSRKQAPPPPRPPPRPAPCSSGRSLPPAGGLAADSLAPPAGRPFGGAPSGMRQPAGNQSAAEAKNGVVDPGGAGHVSALPFLPKSRAVSVSHTSRHHPHIFHRLAAVQRGRYKCAIRPLMEPPEHTQTC